MTGSQEPGVRGQNDGNIRARPLEVTERDQHPVALLWRGRQVRVNEIRDDWEEVGCWWLGEEPRRVYRVLGDNGVLYELHRQESLGWRLQRVFD